MLDSKREEIDQATTGTGPAPETKTKGVPMRYRSILVTFAIICTLISAATKAESYFSFGVTLMLGGRYDDIRMCVATPDGVKGGPIADIMLSTRYHLDDENAVGLLLPVFRPILFGAAFKMLQFEPQLFYERRVEVSGTTELAIQPSLGVSFHYGPDYETEKSTPFEERDNFFAAGPLVSTLIGLQFGNEKELTRMVGVRPFYVPLFAADRKTGTVLGAVLEGHFDFADSE